MASGPGFVPGLTGGSTGRNDSNDVVCTVTFAANTDGSLSFTGPTLNELNKVWGVPITAGVGSSYWVRFTRTAFSTTGTGGSGSATNTTGWLRLDAARSVSITANKVSGVGTFVTNATYTVDIATDSGGSNIVATATGYSFTCTAAAL